jgi:predicted phage tail protein
VTAPVLQGAKGASRPIEADDTLKSTQRADIVDLLGEGQIGGLVNGLKSIYLDGVPVENADGSRNFAEFGCTVTLGGPTSEAAHEFGDVQSEIGVGVTVLAAVPVVRTVTDPYVDSARVTLQWPQLLSVTSEGDRVGASVQFAIDVQSNGGGYVTAYTEVVSGKASSAYSRAVVVPLAKMGPAPWDIRVRRVTPDSTSTNLQDAFAWASYTLITGVKMRYRNSAVVRLTFDAKNFSAIPQRWYDVMGISDWDIPVNYNPIARTVAGTWNGLWKQGWTNNPAWVLYNLVKHPRYGLGQYVRQLPDKWTLYQLALWCDQPLSDGRGGIEPRYSVNVAIVQQSEALRLLQEICAVFRGVLMHGSQTLTLTWDAPGDPVASYTPANVVDGLFTYADGSSAAKKTSCTCWYTDRSQAAKRVPVTWDDRDLVARYGLRTMEINPIGVSTPGQALRMAKWALYTAHYEEQTVVFRVGGEGPVRRLGEVFQISDPSEAGERLGGRIASATLTTLQLDAPVTLAPGETYTVWVTQPHASDPGRLVLESRNVTTPAGTVQALTVSPAFSAVPVAQTVWLLEGSDVAPTLWRYVAISEVKGDDGRPEYEVMGVRHEPSKWALIEADQPLTTRPTRRLRNVAPKPTGLSLAETSFLDGATPRVRATVSWTPGAAGLSHIVAWRLNQGPWTSMPATATNTVDIDGLRPGSLQVQVRAQNAQGVLSMPAEAAITLTGFGELPPNVQDLVVNQVPAGIRIGWAPYSAANAGETELRVGGSWGGGTLLWRGRASSHTWVSPPAGTYTIWAKHFDLTGTLQSATAQNVVVAWDGTSLLSILTVGASSQFFKVTASGATTPGTITVTAKGQNLGGSPVFQVIAGTVTTAVGGVLTGTGNSRTIAFAEMTTDLVTIRVTWGSLTDEISLFRLYDGSDALTAILTNESHLVPADAAGVVSSYAGATGTMLIFKGATQLGAGTAPSVSFSIAGFTGFGPPAFAAPGTSVNGGAIQVDGSTGVYTVFGNLAADSGTVKVRATLSTGQVIDRIFSISKARAGVQGADGLTALLSNESHAVPVTWYGAVITLAGASTTMTIRRGQVDESALWSFSKADSAGISSSISGNTVTVTAITADSAYIDITASRAGYPSFTKRFTVTRNREGTRGTVQLSRAISFNFWSDSEALAAIAAAGYVDPILRDLVTLYNTAAGYSETRFFNGSGWSAIGQYLNGNLFVNGTIAGDKLIAGTVTADKMAAGALTVADGSITNAKIANAAVDTLKIAGLAATGLIWGQGTAANLTTITINVPAGEYWEVLVVATQASFWTSSSVVSSTLSIGFNGGTSFSSTQFRTFAWNGGYVGGVEDLQPHIAGIAVSGPLGLGPGNYYFNCSGAAGVLKTFTVFVRKR